ncbi:provicilin [Medicago truncatula]|uniref:Cupin, RmlC-type n=2 Tax=Medicago truncatula TaxID=3880 RepID=Q2HW21_MEDTR|nr:provicilin [Medicago truncatula]ABD28362.1 Cupin, RmlC-type [Medicago truncatula]AES80364.1 vicilin 47 kDa protein [Medicago truncatula]
MAIKAPFQLLMLLGIFFLASVCVSSRSDHDQENPFFFNANRFQTLFENENGHIRLLQRFDKRSKIFENLQNYRLLEYHSKPHTLFLPQHNDADFILAVLSGKAILTVLNPNDRNSFNLERGDTIKLPAGSIAYLANRADNEDLRVLDLAIPVNRPGQFQSFSLSGNQNQQSFFSGFSKNILEAAFNSNYEEIERVLIEEQEQEPRHRRGLRDRRHKQSQEANVIVKVSREQIEELSRHAKSSSRRSASSESASRRSASSESAPFNLRSREPIYSNEFGNFFEITPEKNPQLQDLDILVNYAEIREGSLLLPHFNSRATVIVAVEEGKGEFELVGQRNENQQEQREYEEDEQEEERSQQVQRYRARLTPGDVYVIPAGYPNVVKASSDLSLLGFGINAENNQRSFLAGEEDNVISQIQRPVKELAFPGSAQDVESLLKNQRQSYFANAQPQQREREEGRSQRKREPISSISGTF